jgi:modulator of FtsH protease
VLTGLLFVSLSINLQQILKQVWLPRRAALAVMLLVETLVIAILGLVPGRRRLPGAGRAGRGDVPAGHAAGGRGRGQPGRRERGGLFWLVPAIVLLLGVGVMNAWVLLVEILR